jgi:hypothetical protein
MERPEKVATPFTAATVVEPARDPEEGLVPIERVTEAEEEVTVFPCASWMRMTGWMAQTVAAEAPEG